MKRNYDYDIAIIGLGPAGSTLVRLLSPKYKIIAIDKKVFGKDGFQKPCGGLISGDAQKALASFDLTLPKEKPTPAQQNALWVPMGQIPSSAEPFTPKRRFGTIFPSSNGSRKPTPPPSIPASSTRRPPIAAPGLFPKTISSSSAVHSLWTTPEHALRSKNKSWNRSASALASP